MSPAPHPTHRESFLLHCRDPRTPWTRPCPHGKWKAAQGEKVVWSCWTLPRVVPIEGRAGALGGPLADRRLSRAFSRELLGPPSPSLTAPTPNPERWDLGTPPRSLLMKLASQQQRQNRPVSQQYLYHFQSPSFQSPKRSPSFLEAQSAKGRSHSVGLQLRSRGCRIKP